MISLWRQGDPTILLVSICRLYVEVYLELETYESDHISIWTHSGWQYVML